MGHYQLALYGFLTIMAMTIIQFFVSSYFKKAEKMKDEKIDNILKLVKDLTEELKHLNERISDHNTDIALCKADMKVIIARLDRYEDRLRKLESK